MCDDQLDLPVVGDIDAADYLFWWEAGAIDRADETWTDTPTDAGSPYLAAYLDGWRSVTIVRADAQREGWDPS
jgi:hypothetical protein